VRPDAGHELVDLAVPELGVEEEAHDGGRVADLVVEEALGQVERERDEREEPLAQPQHRLVVLERRVLELGRASPVLRGGPLVLAVLQLRVARAARPHALGREERVQAEVEGLVVVALVLGVLLLAQAPRWGRM
jgi:hypothetical protein